MNDLPLTDSHLSTNLGIENSPQEISMRALIEGTSTLLFDAFGVLINGTGVMPGATELIDHLNQSGKGYFIVSNTASKTIAQLAEKFSGYGLAISDDRIITSGSLLQEFFLEHSLTSAPTRVVGSRAAEDTIRQAGGTILDLTATDQAQVFVINDLSQPQRIFSELELILNQVANLLRTDREPFIVVANPDPCFPKSSHEFGLAPGSLASLLQSAIEFEFPGRSASIFHYLGKPYAPIFNRAIEKAETSDLVMIGDHIATDIQGAARKGLRSALVTFDSASALQQLRTSTIKPTYLIGDFALG